MPCEIESLLGAKLGQLGGWVGCKAVQCMGSEGPLSQVDPKPYVPEGGRLGCGMSLAPRQEDRWSPQTICQNIIKL